MRIKGNCPLLTCPTLKVKNILNILFSLPYGAQWHHHVTIMNGTNGGTKCILPSLFFNMFNIVQKMNTPKKIFLISFFIHLSKINAFQVSLSNWSFFLTILFDISGFHLLGRFPILPSLTVIFLGIYPLSPHERRLYIDLHMHMHIGKQFSLTHKV